MTRLLALLLTLLATAPLRAQAPAQLIPGFTGGGASGMIANVKGDIHGGGVVAKLLGTVISGGVQGVEMGVGPTAGAVSAAKNIFDPAFLLGNLPGGVIGGALGAAIPLPAALSTMGIPGEMLKLAPPLLGAVFLSAAAMQAIDLHRDHKLTWKNLAQRMDLKGLLAVSVGVDVAVILARSFVPILMLGPLNLTEVAAALTGGYLAQKLLNRFRQHSAAAGQSSAMFATGLQSAIVPKIDGPRNTAADAAYKAYVAAEQRGDPGAAKVAHEEYLRAAQAR